MFQALHEACMIALHQILYVASDEMTASVLVARSNALLAADRLSVPSNPLSSPTRRDNVLNRDIFSHSRLAVVKQIEPRCSQMPFSIDVNNNARNDNDNNNMVGTAHRPTENRNASAPVAASTDGIGTLPENAGTHSISDRQAETSQTLLANEGEDRQGDDAASDALSGEMSDMSIDIEDGDLDAYSLIQYVAPELGDAESSVVNDSHFNKEPDSRVSLDAKRAAREMSTQDKGRSTLLLIALLFDARVGSRAL